MGHFDHEHEYGLLQQRITQKVQGNPGSPTLMKILRMLYSPEDAELAAKLPHNLTSVEVLSKKLKIPPDELNARVKDMAYRGLVFDLEHKGKRYVTLPPVVIGFFEFVFMRTRTDIPMKELAHLFEEYFTENNGALARFFWKGQTQLARTFVSEEAISGDEHTEILDWEKATHIVSTATAISVGICQCLHTAEHHGKACDKPREVCLSFNYAAESLSRNGISRLITKNEAMAILAKSKEANLAQVGDNVQRNVSFICNCCKCCCHMMRGMKTFNIKKGIATSNWILDVDASKCRGCGECSKTCPVDAISIEKIIKKDKNKKLAVCNEEICLGCGVCKTVCKTGGATMKKRPQRILVPETIFEQRVAMAIERSRLADLIFDDPGNLGHRALGKIIGIIEKTSPFKSVIAIESIKSSFLNAIVKKAKKQAGELTDIFS